MDFLRLLGRCDFARADSPANIATKISYNAPSGSGLDSLLAEAYQTGS